MIKALHSVVCDNNYWAQPSGGGFLVLNTFRSLVVLVVLVVQMSDTIVSITITDAYGIWNLSNTPGHCTTHFDIKGFRYQ